MRYKSVNFNCDAKLDEFWNFWPFPSVAALKSVLMMRRLTIFLMVGMVGVAGCRKETPKETPSPPPEDTLSVPTAFVKAVSLYLLDPYGESSSHTVDVIGINSNHVPNIVINGYTIPSDRITSGLGEYHAWDTLPMASPLTDVSLNVAYYDLNDERKETTSQVHLPPEPHGMALSITGSDVSVSWNKPDSSTTHFIYIGLYASCTDGYDHQNAFVDTVITDIGNTTSVSRSLPSICDEIDSIAAAYVYATVFNMQGPWSGDRDNVEGAKGQYYGGAGKADTASYHSSYLKVSQTFTAPRVDWGRRILKALGRYGGER